MALFIVLWLMNSSQKVQQAVAGYFRDPAGTGKLAGMEKDGKGRSGSNLALRKEDMPRLKEALEKSLRSLPDFANIKDQVVITVTPEGLRVEMLETEKGTFFESGSAKPTRTGTELLRALAEELGKLPNGVLIEGHTDARPYAGGGSYSNWELSADRANQARQFMQACGLRQGQVLQVRGFADQELRNPADPNDPANRRITVLVTYRDAPSKAGSG
jgi:chemotaxis protein MotB